MPRSPDREADFEPTPSGRAGERAVLTVAELNRRVEAAVNAAFPDPVWVRGEVQGLKPDAARRKHVYFELHDAGERGAAAFQIPAAILDWDRRRFALGRYLDGGDADFQLRNELEVCLLCRVSFYPPFGRLGLNVIGVDTAFSLGRLEARRREVLARLKREGLLERNAGLPLPELPLRVGLVTAAGSAAERDFRSGLEASPFRFAISLVDCRMQGEQTEQQVVQALSVLAKRDVDVVVITRGGGSRADLSWFDQFELAVAIAHCSLPVITAIGHEVDRSIADAVAHTACKTPTAAAELLVRRIEQQAVRLAEAAARLQRAVPFRLSAAAGRVTTASSLARVSPRSLNAARRRLRFAGIRLESRVARRVAGAAASLGRTVQELGAVSRAELALAAARRRDASRRLRRAAPRAQRGRTVRLRLAAAGLQPRRLLRRAAHGGVRLARLAARLVRRGPATVGAQRQRLELLAGQARLLDPRHLLERGFTLTRDRNRRLVRRADALAAGETIATEFADGEVRSVVAAGGGRGLRTADGGQRGRKETRSDQESLF
jgi:exodeoxyribonuclease VII large subunit